MVWTWNKGCERENKLVSCFPTGWYQGTGWYLLDGTKRMIPFMERRSTDIRPDLLAFEIDTESACHDDWPREGTQ